ncbi:transposase [Streptococcus equi subsp. zooepidemicus]|nr:transposase [Streptococcus equi subsp. zooepidemicus]
MAKTSYSLSHTKWMYKYHIVFTPKYRRKSIYYTIRQDLIDIFRHLCQYKGVEIESFGLEATMLVPLD